MSESIFDPAKSDITFRLHRHKGLGLDVPSLMAEAAGEIERLRSEVRDLRKLKSADHAYEQGYSDAQANIRQALGITE